MPIFITQGRYTHEAIKGMVARPEDRAEALSRLFAKAGGRLIGFYLTFGEYDFLTIAEVKSETQMAAVLLAGASHGRGPHNRTNPAPGPAGAKGAFAGPPRPAPSLRSARRTPAPPIGG